ncbi:MAG: response regulator transcription factor [Gemmatimonadetes bacterium]|nr:response regulator transcription factor [Gemmatimonadota bacterium]
MTDATRNAPEAPTVDSVRALIVDDEPLARVNLQRALEAHPRWRVEGTFADAHSALAAVLQAVPDVVFLDIRMPRTSGLVLARRLAELPVAPLVVFVTAYEGYALEAFELHALDYLIKPFDDARLASGLRRIEALLALRAQATYGAALRAFLDDTGTLEGAPAAAVRDAATPRYLQQVCVKSVGRLDVVQIADVRRIVAAGNYVELHLGKRVLLHRVTLAALEARLDAAEFLRVHRRVIVRRSECRALTVTGDGTFALRLHGGASVPVSERHVADVRALLADR